MCRFLVNPPTHEGPHIDDTVCLRFLSAVYPNVQDPDAVEVTADDLKRLQQEEFLNDNIIDMWLKKVIHGVGKHLDVSHVTPVCHVYYPMSCDTIGKSRATPNFDYRRAIPISFPRS